jgi:hypothetical protein
VGIGRVQRQGYWTAKQPEAAMGRFAGEGDGVCGPAVQPVVDVELRWSWTPFPACEEIVIDIVIVIAAVESYERRCEGR